MKSTAAALVALPALLSTANADSGKTAIIAIPGETTLTVVAARQARHTGQPFLAPGGPAPYDLPGGEKSRKGQNSFRNHLAVPRDELDPHGDGDCCQDHALAPRAAIAIPHALASHIGPRPKRRSVNGPENDSGEDSDSESDSELEANPEDSPSDFAVQPPAAPAKRMVFADETRTEDLGAAFTQQGAHQTVQWPGLPKGMVRQTQTATDVMHIVDVPANHGYGGPGQPPIETMPPRIFTTTSYTTHWPNGINTVFDKGNAKDGSQNAEQNAEQNAVAEKQKLVDAQKKISEDHRKAADENKKASDEHQKKADQSKQAADENNRAADYHNQLANDYNQAIHDETRGKPQRGAAGTVSPKGTAVAMAAALGLAVTFAAIM